MLINLNTTPLSVINETQFRKQHPKVSFPRNLSDMDLSPWGVDHLTLDPKPETSEYQQANQRTLAEKVDGVWRLQWDVVDLPISRQMVNRERDRRIALPFDFNGTKFSFDADSKARVTGAATLAGFAMGAGATAENYRWHGGDTDFMWIADDNSLVRMDAPTCFAFGQTAARHETAHIFAAKALKDAAETPHDFTDDKYWP